MMKNFFTGLLAIVLIISAILVSKALMALGSVVALPLLFLTGCFLVILAIGKVVRVIISRVDS